MIPNRIYHGDALEVLKQWPDECIDMVVTSPPYWRLRDYGIPGQLGLEKTPEEYIEKIVAVFREVRRVLRPWGTVWLNLGDSYAGSGKGAANYPGDYPKQNSNKGSLSAKGTAGLVPSGLKPKDLCMMPARVALALQADGWWLRSDIIWAKPNPMPESVTDRPTSSYEHVFLLTKSAKYFYDADAIRIPIEASTIQRYKSGWDGDTERGYPGGRQNNLDKYSGTEKAAAQIGRGRNPRNVWTITTQPYPEAHYATFPEELPRRCILAGTSAKGNCAECGRPWTRIIESHIEGKPRNEQGRYGRTRR